MHADQLASLTVKDLRALASEQAITGRQRMKKAELVAALSKAMAGPQPDLTALAAHGTGSSATSLPAQEAVRQDAPQQPDPGLPIAQHYGQDRLVLMAQDPFHLFAYWELSGSALARCKSQLAGHYTTVLVLHSAHGCEQREVDLIGGNYYLSVAPGQRYRAELALRSADGRLIPLVSSKEVETPPAGPSDRNDEEWLAIDQTFHQLLERSGLPSIPAASAELVAEQRLRARLWQDMRVTPISSGALSSKALSSWNLSSRANSRHDN